MTIVAQHNDLKKMCDEGDQPGTVFELGSTLSGGGSSVQDECQPDRPFAQRILATYLAVVEDYRGRRASKAVATERLVNALSGRQQSDHERRTMSRTRSPLHSGSTPISSTSPTESKHEYRR
jgi:hypothetical protein